MDQIRETIEIYERIRASHYLIAIPDLSLRLPLSFIPSYYHHLMGFQHLVDRRNIASPVSAKRFYRELSKGKIPLKTITESRFFSYISERIDNFYRVEEMLNNGDLQIIVEFDALKARSNIDARFYLFQRDGNPLNGEPVTYYNLFLNQEQDTGVCYPVTFLVEHSRMYVSGQNLYDCKITKV